MSIVYLILISSNTFNTPKLCQSMSTSLASSTFLLPSSGYKDLFTKIINVKDPLPILSELLILQPTLIFQKVTPYSILSLFHHYYHHQDALKKLKSKDTFTVAVLYIWQISHPWIFPVFFLFFLCFISCFHLQ